MNVDPIIPSMPATTTENRSQKNRQNRISQTETIDKITNAVINPRDVNDCVTVPRGIFKAYLLIMSGSGLLTIANYLPSKMNKVKKGLSIIGTALNITSAWFFAKPFAVTGLSPTVKKNNKNK